MPANLTPVYHNAEERYKNASSDPEKLEALQEMLAVIPKHKGTEKLQAEIKKKIARLRKGLQKPKSSGPSRQPFHHIDRDGAGRVVLSGPPNSGKSSLLKKLTHAEPEIAAYPFTTRAPHPGMMEYEDIMVQLVDMPPLSPEVFEPWQLATLEQSDVNLFIFDVSDPLLLEQTEYIIEKLDHRGITLQREDRPKSLILANKMDSDGAASNLTAWMELFEQVADSIPVSIEQAEGFSSLKELLFNSLGVLRAYTRPPGGRKPENEKPYVLKKGASVLDAAAYIHKDLASNFKYARLWREGQYDGQMVERDHLLNDGDCMEIHA